MVGVFVHLQDWEGICSFSHRIEFRDNPIMRGPL